VADRDDHLGRPRLLAQQFHRGQPVDARHTQVHQDDVGMVCVNRCEDFATVARLADDVKSLRAGQHHPQTGAHQRIVVNDQDPDALAHDAGGRVALNA
jgi:hypothetical protein